MESGQNIEVSKESKTIGTIIDDYENKYEGEILNGQANGKGTKTYKDGRIYTGEFKNNKREGFGKLLRPDGTQFIGNYINDLQEGLGININKEGKELKGFFHNGKAIKGKSIMYYNEPDINKMHFSNIYEGDYINNKREGYGKFIMSNGDIYEGEFQKDSYNGKGKYYWQNGNIYEGGFKNNKKEGRGKLTYSNGLILDCLWKDDDPLIILISFNILKNIALYLSFLFIIAK